MGFDISALTSAESSWDTVGVWLAIAVAIGVSLEAVTEFDTLAGWLRLDTQERFALRHGTAKAGLLLLIVALAFEVVAAVRTHNISEQIIAGLNGEIQVTQAREQKLIDETNALRAENNKLQVTLSKQEGTLASLGERSNEFEKAAHALTTRTDASLARLRTDEENLEKAQRDAAGSAGKAANAAQIANNALADMNKSLTDVQAMRQRLQEMITPREIDDVHFAAMVKALNAFPNTPVDLALSNDPGCIDLLVRIASALLAAKWDIRPWQGRGLGIKVSALPDLPNLGNVTARGVQVAISEADRETLATPAEALLRAIDDAGIHPISGTVMADKLPDGKPNPNALSHGVIHMVVGLKQ
jgi:hypothetical protein